MHILIRAMLWQQFINTEILNLLFTNAHSCNLFLKANADIKWLWEAIGHQNNCSYNACARTGNVAISPLVDGCMASSLVAFKWALCLLLRLG
jgi:hypothetical protein